MNQDQNNLNTNNFNIQGNNRISNNQSLNNQTFNQGMGFNQQQVIPQPQPISSFQQPIIPEPTPQSINTFESGNDSNQNLNSKPLKKKKLWLIIGIISIIIFVISIGIILLTKDSNVLVKPKNSEIRKLTFYNKVNESDWIGNLHIPQEYSVSISLKENQYAKFSFNNNFYTYNELAYSYAKNSNVVLWYYYYEPYNSFISLDDLNHTMGENGYNEISKKAKQQKINKKIKYKNAEIIMYGSENDLAIYIVYNMEGKYFLMEIGDTLVRPNIDFGKVSKIEPYTTNSEDATVEEMIKICKSIINDINLEKIEDNNNAGYIKISTDIDYVDIFNDNTLYLNLKDDNVDINQWYRNDTGKSDKESNSLRISSRKKDMRILLVEFRKPVEDIYEFNKINYPLEKYTIKGIDVYVQMIENPFFSHYNGKSSGMFYIKSNDNHVIGIDYAQAIEKNKIESTLNDIFDLFFTKEK